MTLRSPISDLYLKMNESGDLTMDYKRHISCHYTPFREFILMVRI